MNVKSITCKNTADAIEAGIDPVDIVAEVARRVKNKGGKMSKSHRRILSVIEAYAPEHDTVLDTIASDSDAMSGHNVHVRTLEGASYDDLAAREAELDREMWEKCLEAANGSRWEAYHIMDALVDMTRKRIAAAAGCKNVNSVTQGISKYRRGITPDLSFAGK